MSQEQGKQSYGIIKPNRKTHTHTYTTNKLRYILLTICKTARTPLWRQYQTIFRHGHNKHPSIQPNFIKYKNSQSSCTIPTPCGCVCMWLCVCVCVEQCLHVLLIVLFQCESIGRLLAIGICDFFITYVPPWNTNKHNCGFFTDFVCVCHGWLSLLFGFSMDGPPSNQPPTVLCSQHSFRSVFGYPVGKPGCANFMGVSWPITHTV